MAINGECVLRAGLVCALFDTCQQTAGITRSAYGVPWAARHLCHQQADSKPPSLAFIASKESSLENVAGVRASFDKSYSSRPIRVIPPCSKFIILSLHFLLHVNSGPLRYDCVSPPEEGASSEDLALKCSLRGRWVYHRDGRELLTQLDQEMDRLIGASPQLSAEH
eukprot:1158954-Pelagomonas_calceolata.AAC.1